MSTTEQPPSGIRARRELTLEELDSVVGGISSAQASVSTHPLEKVAGFDPSHFHPDAAAMASGQAEAQVAHAVQGGQLNTTQAMHLLETAAAADHTSVTQALSMFAGHVIAAGPPPGELPGHDNHGGYADAVGGEIAQLITSHQVTASQAMTDIGNAVTAHALTGDQAMKVLEGVAHHGDAAVQAAVGTEIAALINAHQITPGAAMMDIHGAVEAHNLTALQAVNVLASVAGHGDVAMQQSVGAMIGDLTQMHGSPKADDGLPLQPQIAINVIDHAISSHILTTDQALAVLVGIASSGNSTTQTAVNAEINHLVGHSAGAADHALQTLASLPATGSTIWQHAIGGAMAAVMMNPRTFTMEVNLDHAINLVAGIAASRDVNGQLAIGGELGAAADALRGQDVARAIADSDILTRDQALMVLTGMTATGNSTTQAAVGRIIPNLEP